MIKMDYNKVQRYCEGNAGDLTKNDLNSFFEKVNVADRGMIVTFLIKELGINVFEYLTVIHENLFAGTTDLFEANFVIPKTITEIGSGAFYNSDLQNVDVQADIKKLEPGVFANTPIQKVTLPEGLQYVMDNAFQGCDQLTMVKLPSTIAKVKRGAFKDCLPNFALGIPKAKANPLVLEGLKIDMQTRRPDTTDDLTAFYAHVIRPY